MAFPTIPYRVRVRPVNGTRVERADGGNLFGQDLAGVDTFSLRVSWSVLDESQRATILADFAASRNATVTVNGNGSDVYTCIWRSEPVFEFIKESGTHYSAVTVLEGTRN